MSDTIKVHPGKDFYCYESNEVVWLRDEDHTPHNKRHGECDSVLMVEVRAPGKAGWVTFRAKETTTTRNYNELAKKQTTTRDKEIWFTISREQFDAIAAHIARTKLEAEAQEAAEKDHS